MSDPRLTELFSQHSPPSPSTVETAAALDQARPAFVAARTRHRTGLVGAALIAVLVVAGASLTLDDTDPAGESVAPISTTTLDAAPTEHFESPGGSVDATLDSDGLTLVASMAADGYIAMIDLMTADRLEVSFTGPDRYVIALTVDEGGTIIEIEDEVAEAADSNPHTTTIPAAPTSSVPTSAPDTDEPTNSVPSTTSSAPTATSSPPDDDGDEASSGPTNESGPTRVGTGTGTPATAGTGIRIRATAGTGIGPARATAGMTMTTTMTTESGNSA